MLNGFFQEFHSLWLSFLIPNPISIILSPVTWTFLNQALVLAEDGDKVQDDDDDAELRKMMSEIFIDNTKLRKQVNFVIRRALKLERKSEKDDDQEDLSGETVLHNYIER